jgi:hypothetical protein
MSSTFLLKRSSVSGHVPALTSLSAGELAVNTWDGKLFVRTTENEIKTFSNDSNQPFVLIPSLSGGMIPLSGMIPINGMNSVSQSFASVLGGYNNNVSGAGSTTVNGEDNDIAGDFAFIGNGYNNKITVDGDFSAILGGSNNLISHENSFALGSNLSSHSINFTYVNNISATGKIYGDGSRLTGIEKDSLKYEEISSNANLQANKNYILIANNFSPTVTLPQNPSVGDSITFVTDVGNNNSIIIDRNNSKINEIEDNLQCDIDAFFTLIYRTPEIGWKLYFK